jgi:hypothetical protein
MKEQRTVVEQQEDRLDGRGGREMKEALCAPQARKYLENMTEMSFLTILICVYSKEQSLSSMSKRELSQHVRTPSSYKR